MGEDNKRHIAEFNLDTEQEEMERNLLNRESQKYTDNLMKELDDKTPNRYLRDMMGEKSISSTTKRQYVDARE